MRVHWMALGAVCVLAAPASLSAQAGAPVREAAGLRRPVPVVASPDYGAGRVRRFLLGSGYRKLWGAQIDVPVLDLARFGGGLRATEESGSRQTKGLKLVAADGREFRFRSVDKEPSRNVPDSLQTPTVNAVLDDQNSALHPAAAVTAAALATAAGIPHTAPILVVLPDDARLGKFRKEFAGVLGTLEIYPDERPGDRPGFGRFVDVVDTEELAERLNETPDDQVDARAYLNARLFDMLINDWDRHPGQWRWGTRDQKPPHRWYPIPLDRDRAFSDYGGALLRIARVRATKLAAFDGDYSLSGLTDNSEQLDLRLLSGLGPATWDSVANELRARLSDAAIAAALQKMPAEYRRLSADPMNQALLERRDKLPMLAAAYYTKLAKVVNVHATDAADAVTIRQRDGGAVEIVLTPRGRDATPYFQRTFLPHETKEVRVYLHGGDDAVAETGQGRSPITVRVVGGGGRDDLRADSLQSRNVRVYDGPMQYGPDSLVEAALDRRSWIKGRGGRLDPPVTDYGSKFGPTIGATFGGPDFKTGFEAGFHWVQHGFRHVPYKTRVALAGGYSVGADAFGVIASIDRTVAERPLFWRLSAMASDLEHPWFYGLGNNTARGVSRELNRLPHREYVGFLEVGARRKYWSISAGPIVKFSDTDSFPTLVRNAGSLLGTGDYAQLGLRAVAEYDSRNEKAYPTRGVKLSLDVAAYPGLLDVESAFGGGELKASTYLSAPLPLKPVLALRAGARRMWGDYPWFEAAFLGGRSTLRGFGHDRFGGDAAVWGGAELRLRLARIAVVLPMDFGVYGLADVGRVWLEGEDFDRWHTGYGGGVWLHILRPSLRGTVTMVWGDNRTVLYIGSRFHF
ncbi:MAG TPA: BamA/TamA family outer membrane protein [Gemmatimonadales bacterium]|nr:BamA/TamA family outer membrane protein [Gemmatimonadales bacterium]